MRVTTRFEGPARAAIARSPLVCQNRAGTRAYLFLFAATFAFVACCAVTSACFLWFALSFFDCFCDACFCTDFGDLSPMVGCLSLSGRASEILLFPKMSPFISERAGQWKAGRFRI